MSEFRSVKSIINWLNQRKLIKYEDRMFTFYYKLIEGRLYTYSAFYKEWKSCQYYDLCEFLHDKDNWYKSKHSEMKWI